MNNQWTDVSFTFAWAVWSLACLCTAGLTIVAVIDTLDGLLLALLVSVVGGFVGAAISRWWHYGHWE